MSSVKALVTEILELNYEGFSLEEIVNKTNLPTDFISSIIAEYEEDFAEGYE